MIICRENWLAAGSLTATQPSTNGFWITKLSTSLYVYCTCIYVCMNVYMNNDTIIHKSIHYKPKQDASWVLERTLANFDAAVKAMDQLDHVNKFLPYQNFQFVSLAKVLDRNSFRANQNYSDSFQYLYSSQYESFRTNSKNALYLVWWKTVKNRSDLIQGNNTNESESIRIISASEWFGLIILEKSVWINSCSDCFGLIWIENLVSDWFRLIRIVASDWIGLGRIDFLPFFIKRDTKRFSDWIGMIRVGSDTDIGMNRNSSDWLGKDSYPILSPGVTPFL